MKLVRDTRNLYVARGKKVLHFSMADGGTTDDEVLAVILGRSGTLRAPAIRVGDQMLVGFNADAYSKVLGD